MSTKSKSSPSDKTFALEAEVHALRAKLLKQDAEIREFIDSLNNVAFLLFPKTTISKLRKFFDQFNSTHELQIPIVEGFADGRAHAWTDDRRAKFGAAVSAAFAAKRQKDEFHVYHFKFEKNGQSFAAKPHKTMVVNGYNALANYLGLPMKVKYLKDRMWLKPDGQTFRLSHDHKVVISLNKPITEKTPQQLREEFEFDYHKKHGIYPNEDQIPAHLLNPDKPKRGTKTKGMYNF